MEVLVLDEARKIGANDAVINKRLRLVHNFVAACLFLYLLHQLLISDDHIVGLCRSSLFSSAWRVIGIYVAAHIFASVILTIPGWFCVKAISPRIVLCEDHLIFSGGSVALNYGLVAFVLPVFMYLMRDEGGTILFREDIISISVKKGRFLRPAFGTGSFISIQHQNGNIITGGSLSRETQAEVVGRIERWRKGA